MLGAVESCAIIANHSPFRQEALAWKQSIGDYVAANQDKVTGKHIDVTDAHVPTHASSGSPLPPETIVFYELYNTKAQVLARTHPALINTQKYLLSLLHTSDPNSLISVRTPVSYFDRLRIRPPGPSVFTLGPHIDGGSIERWEDPGFRACFQHILEGGEAWRKFDPFDVSPRLAANQDLYNAS